MAAFVAATMLLAFRAIGHLDVAGRPGGAHWAMSDFRDVVYYPVVAVLDGANPYDAAHQRAAYPVGTKFPVYAPLALALHLPFGLLPYRVAEAAWFALTVGLMCLLAHVILETTGMVPRAAGVVGLATVLMLSRPGAQNLLAGQVTAEVVLGTCLALRWARDRPWLAGVGVAVATLKPTFGGPLVVLLLCARRVRATVIGLAIAGVVSGAATIALVHGAGGVRPLVDSLHANYAEENVAVAADPARSLWRIDAVALAARPLGRRLPPAASLAITLGILAVAGLALSRVAGDAPEDREPFLGIVCLATLTCMYHQSYDALLAALPAVLLARGAPSQVEPPALRAALLALLLVPAVNFAATETGIQRLDVSGGAWVAVTSLNGAALVLALLGHVALALRGRGSRPRASIAATGPPRVASA